MPMRIVQRFCAVGCGRFEKLPYDCRNPCAAVLWTLTSHLAANQLAAGAFFGENDSPGFDMPCCCYPACRRRFFFVEMPTQDLTSHVAANQLAAGPFLLVKMILRATPTAAGPSCCKRSVLWRTRGFGTLGFECFVCAVSGAYFV